MCCKLGHLLQNNFELVVHRPPVAEHSVESSNGHQKIAQKIYNYDEQQKQRKLVKEFIQNKGPMKAADMKELIVNSEHIYQIYPMVAASTEGEYLKLCKKLFPIVHTDKKGGDNELARKLGSWKMQIKTDFEKLKKEALYASEQFEEEPMNLTMADEFIEKMIKFISVYEKKNSLEKMLENEYKFVEEMQAELGKFGPVFARNLRMFEPLFFQKLFWHFDLGEIEQEKDEMLQRMLRVASILLIGRCYAQKFVAFGYASSYALRALAFHKFYGGKKMHINGKEEKEEKWKADVQIGKFYKKYLNFFNAKLQLIAEEIAKKMPENVKVVDESQRLTENNKNIISIAREISHIVFDKFSSDNFECEMNEDEKSENPENWSVFNEKLEAKEEDATEELLTLTMAEKLVTKMKELVAYFENNPENFEKMLKQKFNFAEKMQREFGKEKFGKFFQQNLDKFQKNIFHQMDSIFFYGKAKVEENQQKQLDELKPHISAASVHLIALCYSNKFISQPREIILPRSDYANKFLNSAYEPTVHASAEAEKIMDFYKFYGKHLFFNKKRNASEEIGHFYWKYMTFFNNKLLQISTAMLNIMYFSSIRISDKTVEKLYGPVTNLRYQNKEISRHLFDRNFDLCEIIDEKNDENPWEWSVFEVKRGLFFKIADYAAKKETKKKNIGGKRGKF